MPKANTRIFVATGYAIVLIAVTILTAVIHHELSGKTQFPSAQAELLLLLNDDLSLLDQLLESKQHLLASAITDASHDKPYPAFEELQALNLQIASLRDILQTRSDEAEGAISWHHLSQLTELPTAPSSTENESPAERSLNLLITFKEFLTTEKLIQQEINQVRNALVRKAQSTATEDHESHQQYHTVATIGWAFSLLFAGLISLWITRSSQKNLQLLRVKKWRAEKIAERMRDQARSDALTNLPNRSEFNRHLQEICFNAEKHDTASTLIVLDLDQFKVVNDTCGHQAGDHLLLEIAKRLSECLAKDNSIFARLGGDEFAILLKETALEQSADKAGALMDSIRNFRFLWEGRAFEVGASMGIVPIDRMHCNPQKVLSAADTACYIAKDEGRNRIKVIDQNCTDLSNRIGEMNWAQELTNAIREDRLELFAQEIVPVKRSNPLNSRQQFEFLVRLKTHNGKIVTPAAFIPVAERYHIANQLDRWVIENAFRWISSLSCKKGECLKASLASPCRFSINLSGQSISDPEILAHVVNMLESYSVSAEQVCFEITETAVISNMSQATTFIRELKALGSQFALDDFGSGMSSFAYLIDLEVNTLKIDGSLVRNSAHDFVKYTMLKSIVEIAKAMKLCTVAEFVEDEKTLKVVEEIGIDFAQGYHLHRPQSISKISLRGCEPVTKDSNRTAITSVEAIDTSILA